MTRTARIVLLLILITIAITAGAWAVVRFKAVKPNNYVANAATIRRDDPELWARSVEKATEARTDMGGGAIEIPPQLRHYSDRHWFLATQVAEVRKFNLQSCQDYVDLAGMLERGELVLLPAATDTYVLYGVGARADESVFNRFRDDRNVELYGETELRDAYSRLESSRSKLLSETSSLKAQMASLKKSERGKQAELQRQITAREQQMKANDEDKALLDDSYGQMDQRERLLRDYASLQTLAKSFAGRSFNLDDPSDRRTLKVSMLSSLRPEARIVLEEVAKHYHDKFDRPLPVSSLVRPEQYQHALRRVNRYAVIIETPPHTTGLAFDIDYRYMSGAEQNFLMTELARLKDEGRIEVIRERGANYHVFAFLDGRRPPDDLITASLEAAGAPTEAAQDSIKEPDKPALKTRTTKKSKPKASTSKSKPRKRH